jgi:hypothetical protein
MCQDFLLEDFVVFIYQERIVGRCRRTSFKRYLLLVSTLLGTVQLSNRSRAVFDLELFSQEREFCTCNQILIWYKVPRGSKALLWNGSSYCGSYCQSDIELLDTSTFVAVLDPVQ